jgi:nicotinate phosphoribosyltransferase
MREGTLALPLVPMLRLEGPGAIVQMLETHVLEICNFPSLVLTNAVRYRIAAGDDKVLLEFGLRRAQDGRRASHYATLGLFDGTSNMFAAGRIGQVPRGTMMHAFVEMHARLEEVKGQTLRTASGEERNFVEAVVGYRRALGFEETHEGELAAFISYACAHPHGFLALVDTYNTLLSGVPNAICVANALADFGYAPIGIRIDSGDLAYLSRESRRLLNAADARLGRQLLQRAKIFVSNDIDEKTLWEFRQQQHAIDGYGIGTKLVTCEGSPALGGVAKLTEHLGHSKIKLSDTITKATLPGAKDVYRLIGREGKIILDLMVKAGSPAPRPGERIFARHPFIEAKRAPVEPTSVVPLLTLVWDGSLVQDLPGPEEAPAWIRHQRDLLREDHIRPLNPTPIKVSVSDDLYREMRELWMREAPVPTLR